MSQPDKVIAVCPSCEAKLAVPARAVGKKIRCPKCQTVVAITAEMVSAKPPTPPDRQSAAPAAAAPATPAESPKPAEVSLGVENTFTGPAKKNAASESLGDAATFGGRRSVDDAVVDDDMEIVDLSARYTIEGVLGKGGMGEVQLATDNRLKRKVAIKRVLGDMAKNQTAVRRFMTEAQSIAALNHPNIVQVYDYGRDKNGPFLILEYVEGKSLLDRCQQGAMPLEEAITLTCHLCDGLSRAHELGIVHRDLKPANVLLTKDGVPKLTDFGLARVETGDTGHTMSGAVLGTLDFMPPEQRRDATQADARSDLWSLAATLYQMVTGKSPKVIRLNEVPTSLQSALGRALEDKPTDRYPSVVEFRSALREALNEGQTTLTHLSEGQCPSCGTKNELSRKFCRKCAVSLEMNCLSCSKGMPVWDEVCGSCGTKQSPLITARKEQMQQRQEQAEQFVREGRFREAEQIAAEIHREDDPRFQHLKKWAVDFSEGSKREQRQQQERAGVLHKEARAHQQAYDYSSAIHALEQIPAGLRSADINALLKKLQTQEQRSKDLDEEIRVCVERRQLDGLMPRVDELLQLLPDRVDLRDLRDTLEQREQQRLAAKNSAKAEAQQLLDARKYAECVAVLQRLDGKLRTPDIETLQKDAASKLLRVQNLQKSIDQGVKNNQLQGLLAKLDELLSLKSEVTVADSQLRGQLLNRDQKQKSQIKALLQKVQQLRKEVRFDEALELLRRVPDELQNDAIMTAVEDLQFFADQRSETIEGLTQAHDQPQIQQALALAEEYRGMLASDIIADTAFESAMKECRQRLEELQQAELVAMRRRQLQKKRILIGSVVSLILLVAVAGLIMLRQQRLTAIADAQKRGDDALQAADFNGAIEAYTEVVLLDDTVVDAWAGLALAKLQQTPPDVSGAFGDLEKSAALSPDGEKTQQARQLAHVQRAIERANAGSVSEALQDIGEAAELAAPAEDVAAAKSAVGSAYLKRAEAAIVAKTPETALKELLEARTISPQSDQLHHVSQMIAEAYLDRADAAVQQSEVEPALADIDAARAIQPNLPRISDLQAAALVVRAQQQLRAGDRDKASADFLTAKILNSSTTGLGALAASLADGLVQRCEASFSDAALQEATAALETVSEIDPQSATLKPLGERLSKVLVTEADKGLQAKEADRVALMIESLAALQLQPAEQTRLSNDLAAQHFEQCQQQVAAGDLPASVSTFERLLALASVDEEKKRQAVTALLSVIEPLCLTGLQSQSPDPAIEAVQSLAQADIQFGKSFKDQLKTLSDDVKDALPEGLLETPLTDGTVASSVKIASGLNGGPTLASFDNFGVSVASLGDLDGDGVTDLAVGAHRNDTGGTDRGAMYVQFMNSNGTVKSFTKIASGTNGGPTLVNFDYFGNFVTSLGDLDGNGVTDLAVAAAGDDTGGTDRGAVYVQFMNANGTVASSVKIANGTNGGPTLANSDFFGSFLSSLSDLDGDGVTDLAVGARTNGGAVYVLLLNANGSVKSSVKIASGLNGGPTLAAGDGFIGNASLGDLDSDGVTDLAVGAGGDDTGGTDRGALYVLLLNANGTVKNFTKIASGLNGGPTLMNTDSFGASVASLGDLDGDGVTDLAVGANGDNTGGLARGAVHVVLLNATGTVKSSVKIASGTNGGPTLATDDRFGTSVGSLGDLNVDGVTDLAVGAHGDDTGGTECGAVHVLFFKRLISQLNNQAPPLAIAPFDEAQAKAHQQAWADHLGVPVESTNSIGMKLVSIPPGEFMMGSPESEPGRQPDEAQRRVTIAAPFSLGVHEVTQQQYEAVMGTNPSGTKGAQKPVETVSWDDAVGFCLKLSALPAEKVARRIYRLPTEAEWEYGCRAGTTSVYSFGDDAKDLSKYAWFGDNSGKRAHEVGAKLPNDWGLYDMHGNVWEWCSDASGSFRVLRGGSWGAGATDCRAAHRGTNDPTARDSSYGFRIVCDIPRLNAAVSEIDKALPASLSEGLVAYYPFNGNAKDASGNGNDGAITGASFSADRHSTPDSCVSFKTLGDAVIVSPSPTLNAVQPRQHSLSMWLRVDVRGDQAASYVISRNARNSCQWFYLATDSPRLQVNAGTGHGTSTNHRGAEGFPVSLPGSDWAHVVFTTDESRTTVFIDGHMRHEATPGLWWPKIDHAELLLGRTWHEGKPANQFYGQLDDVRIYNRALSADEVKALYEYESQPPGQLGQPIGQAPPPAVAPFDEAQAKVHQKAWADYLGLPVESTNFIGMKLVVVPPGEFMMGSPESEPGREPSETLHKVTLTQPLQIGTYEVTQAQYEKVIGGNPSKFKGAGNPVEQVGWDDAAEFCRRLSELPEEQAVGHVYRLPTEAEWEYTCRAGTITVYNFGDDASQLGDYAWFKQNSDNKTRPHGQKKPNGWGLYDMTGNVEEWCRDWDGAYASGAETNPQGPFSGTHRVNRRGSWHDNPPSLRSAIRSRHKPDVRADYLGFRVVCEIQPIVATPSVATSVVTPPLVVGRENRSAKQKITFEQQFDLRSGFATQPLVQNNAMIYAEPFGSIMYWAPESLGKWSEIQFRLDLNGQLESVEEFAIGVYSWNRNADVNFDNGAQAFLEVSGDGTRWEVVWSSKSGSPIVDRKQEALNSLKGTSQVFIRARLFATNSFNQNRVQRSQFLRSEPAKNSFPSVKFIVIPK